MLVHAGKELCLQIDIVVAVRVSKFLKARVHANLNANSDADVSPRGPTPPSRRVHRDATQQHILEDAGGVRVRRVNSDGPTMQSTVLTTLNIAQRLRIVRKYNTNGNAQSRVPSCRSSGETRTHSKMSTEQSVSRDALLKWM